MRADSWRRLRRACPLWTPLRLYRWICDRQHEAIEREKFERMLRMAIGEARRVRL